MENVAIEEDVVEGRVLFEYGKIYLSGHGMVTCWSMSFKERVIALLTGRIWVRMLPGPKVAVGAKNPFRKERNNIRTPIVRENRLNKAFEEDREILKSLKEKENSTVTPTRKDRQNKLDKAIAELDANIAKSVQDRREFNQNLVDGITKDNDIKENQRARSAKESQKLESLMEWETMLQRIVNAGIVEKLSAGKPLSSAQQEWYNNAIKESETETGRKEKRVQEQALVDGVIVEKQRTDRQQGRHFAFQQELEDIRGGRVLYKKLFDKEDKRRAMDIGIASKILNNDPLTKTEEARSNRLKKWIEAYKMFFIEEPYYKNAVAFTGPRTGLSKEQKILLEQILKGYFHGMSGPVKLLMHGDCIGADAEVHDLFVKGKREYGRRVVMFPSNMKRQRAFCNHLRMEKGVEYNTKGPANALERNKKMVDKAMLVIACPSGTVEKLRSGTWSTIRYARKIRTPIVVIYPDGTFIWNAAYANKISVLPTGAI